ncbi:hypothetical protein [Lonsdalea britannica]|nr:hypothetical protein [Lonsdalea britannica]
MDVLLHHFAADLAYRPNMHHRISTPSLPAEMDLHWQHAGASCLHVFMTVWINYIGDISAKFTFGAAAIYPSQDERFVVVNPPQGQQALIDLIMKYFEQHPFDKKEDRYYASFYRRSVDTPISGEIPLTHWWDQSPTGPDEHYLDITDYRISSFASFHNVNIKGLRGIMRFWFSNSYNLTCEKNQNSIVDITPNGTQDPTCD